MPKIGKYWNQSLLIQLLGSFLILFVISIALVCFATFFQAKAAIESSVFQRLNLTASLKEEEVNRWLEDQKQNLLSFSLMPNVQLTAQKLLLNPQNQESFDLGLKNFSSQQLSWQELFLANLEGTIVESSRLSNIGTYKPLGKFARIAPQNSDNLIFNTYHSFTNAHPIITLSFSVMNAHKKTIGILGVDLNLDRIDQIIGTNENLQGDSTYLVANLGTSFDKIPSLLSAKKFGSEKFPNSLDSLAIREAMDGKDGQGLYLNYQGIKVIGVYRWLDKHNVALIIEITQKEAFAPARELAKTIFWIGFLLAVIMTLAIWLLAKRITRPIIAISRCASFVANGDLSPKGLTLLLSRQDEIGTLAGAFNQMREQLAIFYTDLEQSVQERTAALLQANQQLEIEIAQRRLAEMELQQAKEAAEIANHTKSRFLTNVSHELRTPLNAILGYTQLLARESGLSESQQEYLTIINRSGEHLLALINDVLQMSKIEAGQLELKPEIFDLYELLENLQEILQLKAEAKKLSLIFACAKNVPRYIKTDLQKLRQVLLNLLSNAIKFTSVGSVTLEISTSDQGDLNFLVEDTGFGIAYGELPKLFQPFVQSESGRQSQHGTGLGLAISQKFVELMGGKIQATSFLGQGSIFTFSVKVEVPELPPQLESKSNRTRVIGLAESEATYRILVVDKQGENRQLLSRLLTLIGFQVQQASNTQEAINCWHHWSPHIILMDTHLPLMDGHEAVHHIKSQPQGKETVVIALSTSAFASEEKLLLATGYDDYLRKPWKEEVLYAKIAQHLGVSYIYEYLQSKKANPQIVLTPASLAFMPLQWRKELYYFAAAADGDEILSLLAEIPDSQAAIATGIANLIKSFEFDKIMELVTF